MNNFKIKNKLIKMVKKAYKEIKNLEKNISLKGEKDLLTTADLKVEKFLIKEINKFMPKVSIISEEYNFDKEKSKQYFSIDPIDGTINYANGSNFWGIQVAYVDNFALQVSVIYIPKLNELYYAIKDHGAFLNNKRIKVNNIPPEKGIVDLGFSKLNPYSNYIIENLSSKVMRMRWYGAASLGFSMVAKGSLIAYALFNNNVWDIEPGYLLTKEAGAYLKRNEHFTIAANSKELLDLLDKVLTDELKQKRI